jgi:hypothetical protein
MIYLDSAALVKLIRREPDSDAFADWLDEQEGTMLVSSTLALIHAGRD